MFSLAFTFYITTINKDRGALLLLERSKRSKLNVVFCGSFTLAKHMEIYTFGLRRSKFLEQR